MTVKRYELVKPESVGEWRALHDLRRAELFERRGVVYNENHPDDRSLNNFPLVLKLGNKVIGTTRLDLLRPGEAAIRLVVIAKNEQRQGHGRILEEEFEKLARNKGVKKLFVNAYPGAVGYYEKLGFRYEDWEDPASSHSDSIQMAKII